jgi:hypothetical protein
MEEFMARTKRTVQNTQSGSNAMEIQRVINSDYAALGRDYRKLAIELWRIPAAKYILGGVVLAAFGPALIRQLRTLPQVDAFISDNIDGFFGSLRSESENYSETAH